MVELKLVDEEESKSNIDDQACLQHKREKGKKPDLSYYTRDEIESLRESGYDMNDPDLGNIIVVEEFGDGDEAAGEGEEDKNIEDGDSEDEESEDGEDEDNEDKEDEDWEEQSEMKYEEEDDSEDDKGKRKPIDYPKWAKFKIIEDMEEEEKQGMENVAKDSQTNPSTPDLGLAEAELNASTNHEWQFEQLLTQKHHNGKDKGEGRQDGGASRFSQEARFTRNQARKVREMNAASQLDVRSQPDAPSGPHSQP